MDHSGDFGDDDVRHVPADEPCGDAFVQTSGEPDCGALAADIRGEFPDGPLFSVVFLRALRPDALPEDFCEAARGRRGPGLTRRPPDRRRHGFIKRTDAEGK